jgi:hypothetical protein
VILCFPSPDLERNSLKSAQWRWLSCAGS